MNNYKPNWRNDYFVVETKPHKELICLLCNTKFQSYRSSNLKRHCQEKHQKYYNKTMSERLEKLKEFEKVYTN